MQSKFYVILALGAAMGLTSCNKLGELSADNFIVTPSPLEAVSNNVPVTINGRFPEKYMKKKAVVTVTPVLKYANGQAVGQPATFQGEKVQGNDQSISYKLGGSYTMRNEFAYVPDMLESELYLTFNARVGKKSVEVPEVKVANGVLSTSTLVSQTVGSARPEMAVDAYQYAIAEKKQAQIKYLIQQSKVRTSELKTTSVQEFVEMLREIKANQKGYQLENIEVSAYASPDGGMKLNTKLAADREKSSAAYVKGELKEMDFDAFVDSKYTAEDWEGFQELVSQSNMQDKEVVLRVLSMYKDPEEREKQIKNLSAAFTELTDEILPELRRARLTINYTVIGRSDDEIQAQYKADAAKLSVEELLYAATLTENVAEQEDIYQTTTKCYPADYRAYNNLATLAYAKGNLAAAKSYLEQAASKNAKAVEVNANKALVALAESNVEQAEFDLSRAATAKNYSELLGHLQIAKGQYAAAANSFANVESNSSALAQILNKDYANALLTLSRVENADGMTEYLKAIAAVRSGLKNTSMDYLKAAFEKDPSLKERAVKDLEFRSLFENATFQKLVK